MLHHLHIIQRLQLNIYLFIGIRFQLPLTQQLLWIFLIDENYSQEQNIPVLSKPIKLVISLSRSPTFIIIVLKSLWDQCLEEEDVELNMDWGRVSRTSKRTIPVSYCRGSAYRTSWAPLAKSQAELDCEST